MQPVVTVKTFAVVCRAHSTLNVVNLRPVFIYNYTADSFKRGIFGRAECVERYAIIKQFSNAGFLRIGKLETVSQNTPAEEISIGKMEGSGELYHVNSGIKISIQDDIHIIPSSIFNNAGTVVFGRRHRHHVCRCPEGGKRRINISTVRKFKRLNLTFNNSISYHVFHHIPLIKGGRLCKLSNYALNEFNNAVLRKESRRKFLFINRNLVKFLEVYNMILRIYIRLFAFEYLRFSNCRVVLMRLEKVNKYFLN